MQNSLTLAVSLSSILSTLDKQTVFILSHFNVSRLDGAFVFDDIADAINRQTVEHKHISVVFCFLVAQPDDSDQWEIMQSSKLCSEVEFTHKRSEFSKKTFFVSKAFTNVINSCPRDSRVAKTSLSLFFVMKSVQYL